MNVVTDLAARAVSFITLIQDTVLNGSLKLAEAEQKKVIVDEAERKGLLATKAMRTKPDIENVFCTDFEKSFPLYIDSCPSNLVSFRQKAIDLVWVSLKAPHESRAVEYATNRCIAVAEWVYCHRVFLFERVRRCGSFPTPYSWRQAIVELLYNDSCKECLPLAEKLQYLPLQVVLAVGGGVLSAHKQRILQSWKMDLDVQEDLLTIGERKTVESYFEVIEAKAPKLLQDETHLLEVLKQKDVPLSFELIFHQELNEIEESRKDRRQEQCLASGAGMNGTAEPPPQSPDPFIRASQMNLFAMAFSGGGIRSATLNLGILQGMAKRGIISKFDYLSTVSGGGYIGSWLAAWIKRDGSVTKVSDRLNPDRSPDPFGEEVLPIRWLRMFSNYFAPNASIMSADAWTVGATWLRNTLLNQFIILLLFLALLLTINVLYATWGSNDMWTAEISTLHVLGWSLLIIVPVAWLAGIGMQSYHREKFPPAAFNKEKKAWLSIAIIAVLFAGAYVVSAWLYARSDLPSETASFYQKLRVLQPAAYVCAGALFIIAVWGRYDKCLVGAGKSVAKAWFDILYTAILASFVGLLLFGLVWKFFEVIKGFSNRDDWWNTKGDIYNCLLFVIGLPLVMEFFGVVVITRMALLGKYFPDERREWWGRMGAMLHRFVFLYILLAGASLIGKQLFDQIEFDKTLFGSWVALVGATVKAGFSPKTAGKEEKGWPAMLINVLAKVGPYLFALGLLVFLPGLLTPLEKGMNALLEKIFIKHNLAFAHPWSVDPLSDNVQTILTPLLLLIIMLATAYRLARRTGVNEFSMHHFYRNRLVRAYLGATRRRVDRDKSVNPFTGFDMQDDVKLHDLRNKRGYYGPYPILNTALNASQETTLDRQDRKAESFLFSPLYCGFDFSMSRASANIKSKSYDYGMRPTKMYAYGDGPSIGTAMAISGAAVNPNQGYHSSAATAFLLTVFNVQMGWWIGNPRQSRWKEADPAFGLGYIFFNLIGKTNTRNDFVCLSDGGHFDNMGLYEMIRRKCSFILLGDGEQDDQFSCEGLANAIRRCRIDFGVEIRINTDAITQRDEHRFSKSSFVKGDIFYPGDAENKPSGMLLYLKSSITGAEPVDVLEYAKKNLTFPHQTTADQFFDEEQFESYRKLGLCIADVALADPDVMARLGIEDDQKASCKKGPTNNSKNVLNVFVNRAKNVLHTKKYFVSK